MNDRKIADVCAVEIANRVDPCTRTFPCGKGCDMLVTNLVTGERFEGICRDILDSGFCEVSRDTDAKHTAVIYESVRERLYVIHMTVSEELRMIWEKKKPRRDLSGKAFDNVRVMQLGIGNYGNHTDNPLVGMGFVVRLGNGHAMIVDGGYGTEGCADNVMRALAALDIATEDGKFIIDGWYITHLDGDHVGILHPMSSKYSSSVDVRSFIHSFPVGDAELINGSYPQIGKDYLRLMENNFPGAEIVTAHPFDVYEYAGAKVRMIYTAELFYSPFVKLLDGNDSSLVFALESEGRRMIFTGDAGEVAARAIYGVYEPSSLAAQALQLPHHGLTTGYSVFNRNIIEHVFLDSFYSAVDPELALLPMGETFNDNRWCHGNNQRKWVFENYPQDRYFLDSERSDLGYDGVNIIRKTKNGGGELTTYLMSSDEAPMVTVLSIKKDGIAVDVNEPLKKYFGI